MAVELLHSTSLALLQNALDYWAKQARFKFIDLPWSVESKYVEATRPVGAPDAALITHHGSFVCSGEQSFLALWDKGLLPDFPGYVGWTPCIRNEPVDELHQYGFMKVELFVPVENSDDAEYVLRKMTDTQRELFRILAMCHLKVDIAKYLNQVTVSQSQEDINLLDIELGSYGWREFENRCYVYGTALAEPRFSLALRTLLERIGT